RPWARAAPCRRRSRPGCPTCCSARRACGCGERRRRRRDASLTRFLPRFSFCCVGAPTFTPQALQGRHPPMRWIVSAPRAVAAAMVFSMLLAPPALWSQGVTTGAITGKVTDAGGQPVALADVRVVNRGTGFTTSTRTRENGLFLVQGLEVGGPYTVTVRAIGQQPYQRDNVDVELSAATRVDVRLSPQAVELAAVSVIGGVTPDFSPTRQGVGSQISDSLVRRIPTFSRDFIDQLKLSPQVVYPATGAASGAGAYNRYNTITIDGANQSERFNLGATNGVPGGGADGKIVSLDAVKEFRVMFTP